MVHALKSAKGLTIVNGILMTKINFILQETL